MGQKKEMTVFLVDDDPLFLAALQHFLSIGNTPRLKIKTFDTGEACLQEIGQEPDIIILDYYLNSLVPNAINGIAILKKIISSHPHIPVIMVSSQDNVEIALDILKNGAFEYVSKSESAFLRIENIIMNINRHIENIDSISKKIALGKTINIILLILFIALFIISRIV